MVHFYYKKYYTCTYISQSLAFNISSKFLKLSQIETNLSEIYVLSTS